MPTATITNAGPVTVSVWGTYPIVSRSIVGGSNLSLLQAALNLRLREYAATPARVTYSDAGRSEAHDAHRQGLLDEIETLQRLISSPAANAGQPWGFSTPY